jgi:predicted nuclease of predicted toxin-antitoxin system
MDEHVPRAVTLGLQLRGIDVLTVQADGAAGRPDAWLLARATELGRVLFSQDADLLREARLAQSEGVGFSGVIYAHQMEITIGRLIADLQLLAEIAMPSETANRVEFLPLS